MTFSLTTVILLFLASANAYARFEILCSKPPDGVNYVSSADTRSTLDILWSCLLTIIACTWSVQHLNVPEQRDGRDPGRLGNIKWTVKRAWTSTKWMLATVMAPEMLLWKGAFDLTLVKSDHPKLKHFADIDGVPWSLSHTYFANIGGFVLRSFVPDQLQKISSHNRSSQTSEYPNPFHLDSYDLLNLREVGLLKSLPCITEEELADKSKSDSFVRAISILQISWMAIQIIARSVKGLAISQLEIGVVAFAVCAIIIYTLSWNKPKGVQTPITILSFPDDTPQVIVDTISNRPKSVYITIVNMASTTQRGSPIPNHETRHADPDVSSWFDELAMILGFVVFGSIHIAAWNFEFPTQVEQILWRWSSMICTFVVLAAMLLAISVTLVITEILERETPDVLWSIFCIPAIILYIPARLFLLVEIFRTLCFLPPSAYITTWASNIPHVG